MLKRWRIVLVLVTALAASPPETHAFLRAGCEAVPADVLELSWKEIKRLMAGKAWNRSPFSAYLEHVYQALRSEKICYIDERVHRDYRLGDLKNSVLFGFYDPTTDQIFIQKGLSEKRFRRSIFHELVHAFQYRYRYPIDVTQLHTLAAYPPGIRLIEPTEVASYLDFFYESQANWYSLTLLLDELWDDHYRAVQARFAAWGAVIFPSAIFPSGMTSLEGTRDISFEASVRDLTGISAGARESAYLFPELMFFSSSLDAISKNSHRILNWPALKFQVDYVKRLEEVYYGELEFLFQSNGNDQIVYKQLVKTFENSFLSPQPGEVTACLSGVDAAIGNASPIQAWLKLNPEAWRTLTDDSACPLFASANLNTVQNFNFLSSFSPFPSPFRKPFHPGQEGTRGDFQILPWIHIHPQLEVSP